MEQNRNTTEEKFIRAGRCLIMSAGDFEALDCVPGAEDCLIAADNGLTYLDRLGLKPDYVIGDYDSLAAGEENRLDQLAREEPDHVTTLPVEKDDTDTMAAVRLGLRLGYRDFRLYGALGGPRLDHTLANLQTLKFLLEQGARGVIVGNSCRLFLLRDETWTAPEGMEGGFSVFAMDEKVRCVTIRGMKYNAENLELTNSFPIGVSNHIFSGQRASITVDGGTALVYTALHRAD